MKFPTRKEIEARLVALAEGRITRELAADWARPYYLHEPLGREDRIADSAIREALDLLMGADLMTTDRPYLHNEEDFRKWLEEFRQSGN